jgi:hypothetical protein
MPAPVPCRLDEGACSRRDSHALDADKLQVARLLTFHFQAKFDCFTNFHHEFVKRVTVRVASRQLWHRGDVHPFFVPLDDHIKLSHHIPSLQPEHHTAQTDRSRPTGAIRSRMASDSTSGSRTQPRTQDPGDLTARWLEETPDANWVYETVLD